MQGCRWHSQVFSMWIQAAAEMVLNCLRKWKSWSWANWILSCPLFWGEQIAALISGSILHWKNPSSHKAPGARSLSWDRFFLSYCFVYLMQPCCASCISNNLICNDVAVPRTFCAQFSIKQNLVLEVVLLPSDYPRKREGWGFRELSILHICI